MELERILRSQGFGSRPECRTLISSGRASVAGVLCTDPFASFDTEGLYFAIDGHQWSYRKFVYLVLNKPSNYECSHKPKYHPSIYSLLPRPLLNRKVQAVGRLDEDTTGLLLLSDDGHFIHTYTSPKKRIPKVYDVTVKHPIDEIQVTALLTGVVLNDEPRPLAAAACEIRDDRNVRLTITEGKYHLVKRMIAAAGNRVVALNRFSIGHYSLPADLPVGKWKWLDADDLDRLSRRP